MSGRVEVIKEGRTYRVMALNEHGAAFCMEATRSHEWANLYAEHVREVFEVPVKRCSR